MTDDLQKRIRERAYAIWLEEGRPQGRAEQHWTRASAELAGAPAEAKPARRSSGGRKPAAAPAAPAAAKPARKPKAAAAPKKSGEAKAEPAPPPAKRKSTRGAAKAPK